MVSSDGVGIVAGEQQELEALLRPLREQLSLRRTACPPSSSVATAVLDRVGRVRRTPVAQAELVEDLLHLPPGAGLALHVWRTPLDPGDDQGGLVRHGAIFGDDAAAGQAADTITVTPGGDDGQGWQIVCETSIDQQPANVTVLGECPVKPGPGEVNAWIAERLHQIVCAAGGAGPLETSVLARERQIARSRAGWQHAATPPGVR